MSWSLRTESAFEGMPNRYPYRVTAPTPDQYDKMFDRLTHGEDLFAHLFPKLGPTIDLESLQADHPWVLERLDEPGLDMRMHTYRNAIGEELAGLAVSMRDLALLATDESLWHERDKKYLEAIKITHHGCWVLPAYIDYKQPKRARYPQVRTYSAQHNDIRQQMGPAWMWQRVLGDFPPDTLQDGRRAFWPDHRCLNKNCVYPRHLALGTPYANDAHTSRVEAMQTYDEWMSRRWARPSPAYPGGLEDIVHESEVVILSDRAVMLPPRMARHELDTIFNSLAGLARMPVGGYTTDPGYHVFKGAMARGFIFDDLTGCWNAQLDLDLLAPHKRTIVHACGNPQCCNIRHMDIAESEKSYYQIVKEDFVTLPDSRIVHTKTGEFLPPYWDSWRLYWEWLRANSEYDLGREVPEGGEFLLDHVDYSHLWVHPLTGCWENEAFYPRWSASGAQQNAYGFHRKKYAELGRSTHRYLYMKFAEQYLGVEPKDILGTDVDHRCNNRRCCNPLHMQTLDRKAHMELTFDRRAAKDAVSKAVDQRQRLRKLGRKR